MSKLMVRFFWVPALLATGVIGGCGREQTPAVPPVVVSVVPANAATGVPFTPVITATFNETMNPATITAGTFTLTGPGGVAVAGTVVGSGLTATFTPTLPLAPSTTYTAIITTGAQSNLNFALAANYMWSFTTGFVPVVTAVIPVNGAGNVALNQRITATFNQPMNPATITAAGTFMVGGTGGAAVAGTVTYVRPRTPRFSLLQRTSRRARPTRLPSRPPRKAPAASRWPRPMGGLSQPASPPTVRPPP